MTKIPMTKTQSSLTILPPLISPFKGEEFYRIKVLNLDIGICLGFSALSSGFPGDNRRGALSPPSYLLTKGYYTLRVRKISTRITSHTTAPRAIIAHNHDAVVGSGGTTPSAPVVKVAVASPNTVVFFIAFTVQ